MKVRVRQMMRIWCTDEKGSLFLEKTILFPTVFAAVFSLLFFSLQNYQQSYLFQMALETAHRLAFVWNNSHKDLKTGEYELNRHDPLYWRWAEGWSGPLVTQGGETLVIGKDNGNSSTTLSLTEQKMSKVWRDLPADISGNVTLHHGWIQKRISVQLQQSFSVPETAVFLRSQNLHSLASSTIVDPVETMRTAELVRSYWQTVSHALTPERLRDILQPFQKIPVSEPRLPEFDTQQEAEAYLRRLVGGVQKRMDTVENEHWRYIGAMDAEGVAHHAKIFRNRRDYMDDQINQLHKDAELLRKGEVKGVVWHFFKGRGEPSAAPDPRLRALLEQNGIIVIVHE